MESERFKLVGYLPPVEGDVGFITPVFEFNEKLFVQVSEKGHVAEFSEVSHASRKKKEALGKTDIQVCEGDLTLFGYKFPAGDVGLGHRDELRGKIRNRLEEIRIDPFDFLNASAFVDQKQIKKEAAESAYAYLARENRETATRWVRFLEIRLDLPRTSKLYELNTIALYDFCRVLIRFAKVYEKYLRNRDKRFMSKYQYESLFHRLATFIFDDDFVGLLDEEFNELKSAPAQLSFEFSEPAKQRVRHLSRLGISKSRISRFYNNVERSSDDSEFDEINFGAILNLDRLMIDEADLSRSLSKVEKKIRKKELSTGLISIIYGTLLILGGMDVWYSRDRRRGDNMKLEGVRAISCGLQNLAPENVRDIDISGSILR